MNRREFARLLDEQSRPRDYDGLLPLRLVVLRKGKRLIVLAGPRAGGMARPGGRPRVAPGGAGQPGVPRDASGVAAGAGNPGAAGAEAVTPGGGGFPGSPGGPGGGAPGQPGGPGRGGEGERIR